MSQIQHNFDVWENTTTAFFAKHWIYYCKWKHHAWLCSPVLNLPPVDLLVKLAYVTDTAKDNLGSYLTTDYELTTLSLSKVNLTVNEQYNKAHMHTVP